MDRNRRNPPRMYRPAVFTADMPLEFGAALTESPSAFDRFQALTEAEKSALMNNAVSIRSRDEMRAFVEQLADSGANNGADRNNTF